jgi:cell wall-associated NlpC family hydrolase
VTERGQISVAAVAAVSLVLLGGVLFGYLSRVAAGGGRAQRAADLSAIAAARALGGDPFATEGDVRTAAARAAAANGARVVSVRVVRAGTVPRAVDVAVALTVAGSAPAVGEQRREVVGRARAGVAFSASVPAAGFRPVDLRGGRGPLAAVAAAEAQVGWPYVWGGESRAEGGFDCSGLVDFAYAAAGSPLRGRPTAADLWHMASSESPSDLAPSDLVFMGARSGAPYHVGMYVGDGMVVVAPHTGAQVQFEPLAAGGWDGFGRLFAGGSAMPAVDPAVEAAARAHQVPPDALAAELRLGLAADPEAAAAALARAMRRHPGDLAAALADATGDPSAGALALRSASGAGVGFSAAVRLLPLPPPAVPPAGGAPRPAASVRPAAAPRSSGGGLSGIVGAADAAAEGVERAATQLDHLGGRLTVQAMAGVRGSLRLGLAGAGTFLPNPHLQDLATFAGAVSDAASAAGHAADGGMALDGASLWAARITVPLGLVFTGAYALQAYRARRRDDRIWYAAQAASTGFATAGVMTAGTDLIVAGAGTVEIPPLGAALMVVGGVILAGGCIYRERSWLISSDRSASRWVQRTAVRAAGAVADAGRSLVDSVNPFSG